MFTSSVSQLTLQGQFGKPHSGITRRCEDTHPHTHTHTHTNTHPSVHGQGQRDAEQADQTTCPLVPASLLIHTINYYSPVRPDQPITRHPKVGSSPLEGRIELTDTLITFPALLPAYPRGLNKSQCPGPLPNSTAEPSFQSFCCLNSLTWLLRLNQSVQLP